METFSEYVSEGKKECNKKKCCNEKHITFIPRSEKQFVAEESIDINAILEAEYSLETYCVGRFMKEMWNANSRSTVEIILGEEAYCISEINDADGVVYFIASTKDNVYEGIHVNEALQALKFYDKEMPLRVLLDEEEYAIDYVNEDKIAKAIAVEVSTDVEEGEIIDAIKNIFKDDKNKQTTKEYSYADFDGLSKNDEYYVRYSGDHIEFLGKDDKIARFMDTTVGKEMTMPKDKVGIDVVKIKK